MGWTLGRGQRFQVVLHVLLHLASTLVLTLRYPNVRCRYVVSTSLPICPVRTSDSSSGFNGNTDYELCSRWMQLSAFFPFYRNHNTLSALSQEPFCWASVISASKTAMNIRYTLLPYMYTLFYEAHTTGSTVMRAVAWEFPNEPQLADVGTQFLLGPNILVTPVLEPQVETVKG